jgi:hypothetical protein
MAVWIFWPAWMTSPDAGHIAAMVRIRRTANSMPEVAHAREDHGHVVFIGGIDHLCIPYGPAGMNYCHRSCVEGLIQAIPEGEK